MNLLKLGVLAFAVYAFAAISSFAIAGEYQVQIPGILQDMASSNQQTRLATTNRLNTLIGSVTNVDELANCRLLMAKLRIECADIMGSADAYDANAYNDATGLCMSVISSYSNTPRSWQYYGASLLVPVPLSMDGQYSNMCCIATNAFHSLNTIGMTPVDDVIWQALFSQSYVQSNVVVALQVLSASAMVLNGDTQGISSYTNGLPPELVNEINLLQ